MSLGLREVAFYLQKGKVASSVEYRSSAGGLPIDRVCVFILTIPCGNLSRHDLRDWSCDQCLQVSSHSYSCLLIFEWLTCYVVLSVDVDSACQKSQHWSKKSERTHIHSPCWRARLVLGKLRCGNSRKWNHASTRKTRLMCCTNSLRSKRMSSTMIKWKNAILQHSLW